MRRRVVVTGIGAITPLGTTIQESWKHLIDGKSGIQTINHFDCSNLPVKIGAKVPDTFNPDLYMTPKEQKRVDRFITLGVCAAVQAVADSKINFDEKSEEEKEQCGVIIGSGIGGLSSIYETSLSFHEKGARRVSPFFIPASLINIASGMVSMRFGLKGPNHSVVTACATGTHAIGDAARMIMYGDADVMIAGGAEAAVCPVGIAGFAASKSLSTRNDAPEKASRPFDKDRDGFIMGEGAGVIVLEEYAHAKKRGAQIYAEVVGYGLSGDAHHVTAPPKNGAGAALAMKKALKDAKISHVDYINAHGTSTPPGDLAEVCAIKNVFPDNKNLIVSSTKSSIGHLLGAAGAVEAIFGVLSIKDQIAPPTLNLDNPDIGCDLNFSPHHATGHKIDSAMSNSFGFGGTNASLIFKKI